MPLKRNSTKTITDSHILDTMLLAITSVARSALRIFVALAVVTTTAGCKQKTSPDTTREPRPQTHQTPSEPTDSVKSASAGNGAAETAPSEAVSAEAKISVPGDGDLVGRVSREMIVEQREDWKNAIDAASPDAKAARALASVEPGAEVTIYFGAWCEDCQRELPRFFKALDIAGEVPFTYALVGVDKYFRADEVSVDPLQIPAVPYFVVERDGQVVGEVVEKPSETIESDLLSLLRAE